jgi:hypothetical protein
VLQKQRFLRRQGNYIEGSTSRLYLVRSFIRSLIFVYAAIPTAQVLCSNDDNEVREKHKEGKSRRIFEGQSLVLVVKGRRKPHQNWIGQPVQLGTEPDTSEIGHDTASWATQWNTVRTFYSLRWSQSGVVKWPGHSLPPCSEFWRVHGVLPQFPLYTPTAGCLDPEAA